MHCCLYKTCICKLDRPLHLLGGLRTIMGTFLLSPRPGCTLYNRLKCSQIILTVKIAHWLVVTDSWCQTVRPSHSPPSDWLRWEREQNSSSPSRCPTATAGGGGAGLHVKAVKMFNYNNTAPDLAYLIYQIMTQLDWGCVCVWVRTHPSTEYHEVLQ